MANRTCTRYCHRCLKRKPQQGFSVKLEQCGKCRPWAEREAVAKLVLEHSERLPDWLRGRLVKLLGKPLSVKT